MGCIQRRLVCRPASDLEGLGAFVVLHRTSLAALPPPPHPRSAKVSDLRFLNAQYRFGLTAFAGTSILVTLGGVSYYGPGSEEISAKASRVLHATEGVGKTQVGDLRIKNFEDGSVEVTDVKKVRLIFLFLAQAVPD